MCSKFKKIMPKILIISLFLFLILPFVLINVFKVKKPKLEPKLSEKLEKNIPIRGCTYLPVVAEINFAAEMNCNYIQIRPCMEPKMVPGIHPSDEFLYLCSYPITALYYCGILQPAIARPD